MRPALLARARRHPALLTLSGLLPAALLLPLTGPAPSVVTSPALRPAAYVNISAGEAPFYRFKTFGLTESSQLKLNAGNGNLLYKQTDLVIPGGATGMGLSFIRYYNSGDSLSWEDLPAHWRLSPGEDVQLRWAQHGSNDVTLVMSTGTWVRFVRPSAAYPYTPDPGFRNLSLTNPVTGTWNVTERSSGTTEVFQDTDAYGSRVVLRKIVDRHNNAITFTYGAPDQWGVPHTTGVTDALGRSVTITRNPANHLVTSLSDWSGRSVRYGYDSSNRLIWVIDAAGGVTRYGYATSAQWPDESYLVSVTDPKNNVTSVVYENPNYTSRVFSITRPGGYRWAFKYDQPISTDCNWNNTASDPPVSSAVVGAMISQDPRSADPFTSPTDPDSTSWRGDVYCFDTQGRVLRTKETDAGSLDYVYDANGYRSGVGWGSRMSTRTFDGSGRLLSTRAPTGATRSVGYTDAGNSDFPTIVRDAQGYAATISYDASGNPTSLTDPASHVQRSSYNSNGTLASSTDERGNVTTYGYAGGNLTTVDPPGTAIGTTTMTYDSLSRPVTVTDGKGQRTTTTYDALDRVVKVTHSDGSFVSYTYDGDGNTTKRQEGIGATVTATTSYAYDSLNDLCLQFRGTWTAPGTCSSGPFDIRYVYDSLGRMAYYTDAGGTVRYSYGIGGRLTQVIEPDGKTTNYAVMDSAALATHPATSPLVSYPNGVKVANTSDDSNRLVRTRATNASGAVLMDLSYGYRNPASPTVDRNLLYTKTDNMAARTTSYGYDPVGNLTSAVEKTSSGVVTGSWTYAYDAAGNRTSKTENGVTTNYTYDAANQLTAANTTTYGHDLNGNTTSSSAGFAATYNTRDQTTTITPAGGVAQTATYAGEGQGELTKLGANTYTNSALGIASESGKYITRRSDGGLVSVRSGASTYYLLQDQLGSVVALTDAAGNKATAFTYDPYGKTTSATGNTALSPFRFAGELYSASLQLSKVGPTYYDAALGSVTQASATGRATGPGGPPFSDKDGNPPRITGPGGGSLCGVLRFLLQHPFGKHGVVGGAGMTGGFLWAQILTPGTYLHALIFGVGGMGSLSGALTNARLQALFDKWCQWRPPPTPGRAPRSEGMDEDQVRESLYPSPTAALGIATVGIAAIIAAILILADGGDDDIAPRCA